jgi:hypothetical protein
MTIQPALSQPTRVGDILLMRGLVSRDGLERALDLQRKRGGRLGECIVALGLMTLAQISAVLAQTPASPASITQTGISRGGLLALLLKFMRAESCETLPQLGNAMRLPHSVLQELLDEATTQRLIQVLGSMHQGIVRYIRYALTDLGRAAAADASAQSQYLGPAPVSLESFAAQVAKQALALENIPEDALNRGFAGLSVPADYIRRLLPAVRAGRTILLYGPAGNGKTSIGTRLATLFRNVIYVPYAVEVGGQIIRMFDGRLHKRYSDEASIAPLPSGTSVQIEYFDMRWVPCRRPIVVAGGELSLDMLDLRYDPTTKYYDAPLHMKALNGLFLIDDFGRQKVKPAELLNRWIVPLENRVDYLTLNTGTSFQIPFDELVVFSTNLKPGDLMDPAFLRRIPYKIELFGPSADEFCQIFLIAATRYGLTVTAETIAHVVRRLATANHDLAYFQANFICEQASQICSCFDLPATITQDIVDEALQNLYVDLKPLR